MPLNPLPQPRAGALHRVAPRWSTLLLAGGIGLASAAQAQTWHDYPITPAQRDTATRTQQAAQAGVPVADLAPAAPERYTVRAGDTLWHIASLFLQQPWRWPELWGMNLVRIRNPHLIYPGQVLVLQRRHGRAVLGLEGAADGGIPTVKLSPRIRSSALADEAIPPIPRHLIEPFLTDSLLIDAGTHEQAARIVAAPENRVLLSRGDRAYARSQYGSANSGSDASPSHPPEPASNAITPNAAASDPEAAAVTPRPAPSSPLTLTPGRPPQRLGVYRHAVPLKDPATGAVLGYEAQFIGKAQLARSESTRTTTAPDGQEQIQVVPATLDIVLAKEEIRIGDRLLPEAAYHWADYVPHAPATPQSGQVVAVHGGARQYAGQNQIVVLNRGSTDGLETGHVLALQRQGATLPDSTDPARPTLALPDERNGLMLVFRTFDRLSYALVLQISDGVRAGDRFTQP